MGSRGAGYWGCDLQAPRGGGGGEATEMCLEELRNKETRRPSAREAIKPAKWIHAEKCRVTLKRQEGSSSDVI